MLKRILVSFLLCFAFLFVLSLTAGAQSGPTCYDIQQFEWYNWFPPGPPGWTCELEFDGGLFNVQWVCTRQKIYCPPLAAIAEIPPGPCPTCGGSPISFTSGNTYVIQTDVRVPGLSNGLNLVRTWNSMWPLTQTAFQTGLYGLSWRSNYEERVFFGADGYYKYSRGDGSFWSFASNGSGLSLAAPANVNATLAYDSSTYTITFQNGEKRIFDFTSGSLRSIVDRNGNTTQLSYDASNRLVTVADPGGRHLYFGYPNSLSSLITTVTSDVGLALSYSYDSLGRLIQVTNPDQTTTTFQYDANSLITAVKDSDGKILESHTYDSCRRGLTSSRAGGAEAITLSYPQPCWSPPVRAYSDYLENQGLP
jgi:YD repeat-containing protein